MAWEDNGEMKQLEARVAALEMAVSGWNMGTGGIGASEAVWPFGQDEYVMTAGGGGDGAKHAYKVRYHKPDGAEQGMWEIYMPKGIAGVCDVLNEEMAEAGHSEDEAGWRKLGVAEESDRQYAVVVHVKRRAKEGLTGDYGPLVFAAAEKMGADVQGGYDDYYAGDAVAQTVATISITQKDGELKRSVKQLVDTAFPVDLTTDRLELSVKGEKNGNGTFSAKSVEFTPERVNVAGGEVEVDKTTCGLRNEAFEVWLKIDTSSPKYTAELVLADEGSSLGERVTTDTETWVQIYSVDSRMRVSIDMRKTLLGIPVYR